MATDKKETKVNLLPQKEFERSTSGRILKWALSSFRTIVIFTEMLVMAAFLSRFWLDAKNSDLNEAIAQKRAIITSFADVEKNFRDTQKRLDIFSKLIPKTPTSAPIKTAISFLPPDVQLTSISESDNSLQITGASASEQGIAQFMANLESVKTFKGVDLTQIDSDKENQSLTIFTIKVNL